VRDGRKDQQTASTVIHTARSLVVVTMTPSFGGGVIVWSERAGCSYSLQFTFTLSIEKGTHQTKKSEAHKTEEPLPLSNTALERRKK
jgi:hypothetical protein